MKKNIFLNELGIICPLGAGKRAVAEQLFLGHQHGFDRRDGLLPEQSVMVGQVSAVLPEIDPLYEPHVSRNNQLLLAALMEIEAPVRAAIDTYGGHRVGVVLGSSTSGMSDGEA
ncbi:MAG: beta-ketoacyl-ACP synthase, partial [Immundisolibacteraceae bacterium]|nr:beta-ketoacyl-ACP synthase [Immundisolibacteraceae bacterium]